ncbi:hypothetical protein A4D02_26820 [Niastella koreensis]|uniref:YetF C-terminal domain-containing protein n=2 Tax=Niastella koreensis TaxID=354356 RepID=G8TFL7_NIAKG|nr:YetF domain-containing protein [Niastella koreensis]AEV99456.1 hypothetical protein Niako_3126 [Niastella koreensis GR20-10]OQP50054.1 hypothetical protein A4D02_26820 [Niastella koreensis]
MDWVLQLFGQGKDLTALQMSMRGIVVFVLALALIRISGRRSFGLHTPLDNIITILLGAVLSRTVVGASPFVPVIICCLVIVLIHRLLGALVSRNERLGNFIEGKKMLLFKDGHFIDDNMKRAQVCKENIMQGIRESALTDDLSKIERVYMERNGVISVIKKQ